MNIIPPITANTEIDEVYDAIVSNENPSDQLKIWDAAKKVFDEKKMLQLATYRQLILDSDPDLFKERIYQLLKNPNYPISRGREDLLSILQKQSKQIEKIVFLLKEGGRLNNLNFNKFYSEIDYDQILTNGVQFAALKTKLAQTPYFARYLIKNKYITLLSDTIKPEDVTNSILNILKNDKENNFFFNLLDEIPKMIENFGILKEHPENAFILNNIMTHGDSISILECLSKHLIVSEDEESPIDHPLHYALYRYMRAGVDGEEGPNDPQVWLEYANRLQKPESAIINEEKVKEVMEIAKKDLEAALKESQRANKPLLFVIGEFHFSPLSWLYEQTILDVCKEVGIKQILIEEDEALLSQRINNDGLLKQKRVANWIAADDIFKEACKQEFNIMAIDIYHHGDSNKRDLGMSAAILGKEPVASLQNGRNFQDESKVQNENTIAIIGHHHLPGVKKNIEDDSTFYTSYKIIDFRGKENAEKAQVPLLKLDNLNPRYMFPDQTKQLYHQVTNH